MASTETAPPGRPARPPRPEARTGTAVPEASVVAMFDEIAPVYDRLNTLMTFGMDDRWRRAAVQAAGVADGGSVIDVASGTGKLAAALAEKVGPFGRVVAVDLSPAMVALGSTQFRDVVQLEFRVANALDLPAEESAFDAATIAFGLRNLADFEAAFRELRRVVRPGGRVVCLELTWPRPRWWARVFYASFRHVVPIAGRVFGHTSAYRYLPASLEGFPEADRLAALMRAAGLVDVRFRRLGLGSVALHTGTVPEG